MPHCTGGSEGGAGGGEGGAGGEGEERPESFEPAEDPTIRPVVQLAVVAKVTGEEHEQTIYAGAGREQERLLLLTAEGERMG